MKLPDVPQTFWSDAAYNTTVVKWCPDSGLVHVADNLGIKLCPSSDETVLIAGDEHDDDELCPGCAQLVTDWIG